MEQTLDRAALLRYPVILLALFFILLLSGCGDRTQAPVIVGVTASPARLFVGEEAFLRVEAYDPKGKPITVSWSTGEGSFTLIEDTQAVWTTSVPGLHVVDVVVTDIYGDSVRVSFELQVDDKILLKAGTAVRMELLQDVRSDLVRIGDLVPLRVVEPVYVQGFEVIPKGAYGIGQVLYVQLPANGVTSHIVLAPTRVELVDGQVAPVDGTRAASSGTDVHEEMDGRLQLAGTVLRFASGESAKVRAGAIVEGVIREDVAFEVRGGQISPLGDAAPTLVSASACLGIHAVDISEFVVSVYSDGIRVEGFETGSATAASGLQVGDRISGIRIGEETYPITSLADLTRVERLLKPGDEVTVLVRNLLRRADISLSSGTCYILP